ncbi:hypothetical protein RMATCC62417_16268 [Rhizopus microsporus]|nr:hypothetical protein RMATCC62417_16268 [Rhizopus microsporus]
MIFSKVFKPNPIQTFEVNICSGVENNAIAFGPGSIINGNVKLFLDKPVKAKYIKIIFTCQEKKDSVTLFSVESNIWNSKQDEGEVLESGAHLYLFAIQLPSNYIDIQYEIIIFIPAFGHYSLNDTKFIAAHPNCIRLPLVITTVPSTIPTLQIPFAVDSNNDDSLPTFIPYIESPSPSPTSPIYQQWGPGSPVEPSDEDYLYPSSPIEDASGHLMVPSTSPTRCLPIVSKHKSTRLAAIAKILSNGYYDIVALQEIWVYNDFEFLRKNVKDVFPFAKYFHSGVFGSGLAVFSKFPIISSSFYPFILNGKPLQVFHGDYYVGKGVGTVRLNHPQLGYLDVFNTHLHAGYGDRYKAHRAAQCWQLANLLRAFVIAGNHVVMTGDLNSIPDSLNYRLIRDHGLLTDSWTQTYDPGFTCNSPFNTFSRYYQKDNVAAGKRLDYILYSHWSA